MPAWAYPFFIGAGVALVFSVVGSTIVMSVIAARLQRAQNEHFHKTLRNISRFISDKIDQRFREIENDISKDL